MGLFDWFKALAKGTVPDNAAAQGRSGESAELAGLDFQAAVAAHQRWKARLQACIDGSSQEVIDPAVACQDNQCVLGKWIYGPGEAAFRESSIFSQLKIEHAQFHVIAGEVLSATYDGRRDEAKQKLDGVFIQASLRVQKFLSQLFLEAAERQ